MSGLRPNRHAQTYHRPSAAARSYRPTANRTAQPHAGREQGGNRRGGVRQGQHVGEQVQDRARRPIRQDALVGEQLRPPGEELREMDEEVGSEKDSGKGCTGRRSSD